MLKQLDTVSRSSLVANEILFLTEQLGSLRIIDGTSNLDIMFSPIPGCRCSEQ